MIHDSTNKHVVENLARDTGEGDWPVVGCTVHTLFENRCDRGSFQSLCITISIYITAESSGLGLRFQWDPLRGMLVGACWHCDITLTGTVTHRTVEYMYPPSLMIESPFCWIS